MPGWPRSVSRLQASRSSDPPVRPATIARTICASSLSSAGFVGMVSDIEWQPLFGRNYPGEWLIRVLQSNAPAALFWRTAILRQSQGLYSEEVRIVNGRPWIYFRILSIGSDAATGPA